MMFLGSGQVSDYCICSFKNVSISKPSLTIFGLPWKKHTIFLISYKCGSCRTISLRSFNGLVGCKLAKMYGLLTKCEVMIKMAGYWPSSFFACLWTETKSRSINSQKKNEANTQPS